MKNNEDENITSVWRDFEKGRAYNRTKNLYTQTEQNYDFYHGDQAKYLKLGKETPIVLNIIKSIVKYKLGVVNSNVYSIVYNPNFYNSQEEGEMLQSLCKVLSKHSNKVWELQQVGSKIRECIKDACINDEGVIHHYFDVQKQEVYSEVIDKNNIYYGNENDSNIQLQPYIIISYRKPVSQVKEEARVAGVAEEKLEFISDDSETLEQAGYSAVSDEVNPMCLVLLKYYKKDGIVYYTKTTKYVEIETDVNTGMTLYPVAHMVWEEVKGSSRGIGAVRNVIPNQIEINKIATRRSLALKLVAFPKLVVNKEMISNPDSLEKVGSTIKITGKGTVDDVKKVVGYLTPPTISSDAKNVQDDLKDITRELEGAGDTATGTVDPTQASGKAILAVQQATQQPLNEQVETYKTFIEDIARIYFDMWKAYKIDGMQVMYEEQDENGNTVEVPGVFPYEVLNRLEANIKVDITPKSPYDKFAQEQSIEGLMSGNFITFEEYVEVLDDDSVMPKHKLELILQKRKENQAKMDQMQLDVQNMQTQLQQAIMQKQQADDTNRYIDNVESEANMAQEQLMTQLVG